MFGDLLLDQHLKFSAAVKTYRHRLYFAFIARDQALGLPNRRIVLKIRRHEQT